MWIYKGEPFDPEQDYLEQYVGFVYMIREKPTGMKYIGKKLFWKPKTLPVTKTRKRKVKTKVLSDWKTYFGSNNLLKEKVGEKGEDEYERTILRLCITKGECSYYEAKWQFETDAILREDYYNELIMCRINSKHIKT